MSITKLQALSFFLLGSLLPGSMALAASATRSDFGQLADGTRIESVELSNGNGLSARVITLGATLQSLVVPGRDGTGADIVLGYSTAAAYLDQPQYFGSTVGRFANRIANGRFELDGTEYELEINDGQNHLHGGLLGFDKVVWNIELTTEGPTASVVLTYRSPDGEGGYPGTLDVRATYRLDDNNDLTIEYAATTDSPTVVNITNHSYFNLAGEDGATDIMSHKLTMAAEQYTPADATLIPTGELRDVAGTPFDFREPQVIGRNIRDGSDEQILIGRGYDHNFVISGEPGDLRLGARLEDPVSGRVMELLTTAPGVQFYSGNFLNGSVTGKSGRVYRQGDALCLEPQVFPDAPNKPAFPTARLDPGDTYTNTMVLRFSTENSDD